MYTLDMYPELYSLKNLEKREESKLSSNSTTSLKDINPEDIKGVPL